MPSDYREIGNEILEKLEIDATQLGRTLSKLSEMVRDGLESGAWNEVLARCEFAHVLCNEMRSAEELREWSNAIGLAHAKGIFHAYAGISHLYQAEEAKKNKNRYEESKELAKAIDCLEKSQQSFHFLKYRDQWNEAFIWLSLGKLYRSQNRLNEALLAFQKSYTFSDFNRLSVERMQEMVKMVSTEIERTRMLFRSLPIIDEIAAGKEKPVSDDIVGHIQQTGELEFEFEGRTLKAEVLKGSQLTFFPEYDYVAVLVSGDSMDEAGISPNDYVILQRPKLGPLKPSSGDIVVVVFRDEDDKATLKRIDIESSRMVILRPESSNPAHKTRILQPEVFAGDNPPVVVVGITIAVLKRESDLPWILPSKVQVFLSYAREDEEKVENLYQKLSAVGARPWMDKKDILPGERWESSIRKGIRRSDFFVACLSANSVNKRGFLQREIKTALDIWQDMLDSDIYLIPVRLEDCEVPESLRDFQWVNLFEKDGWTWLVKAIQLGMERRAHRERGVLSLYKLYNIRTLLTEEFSTEELRRFCYDFPAFRPVYDQLAYDTSQIEIVDRLIEHASLTLDFQTLLDWAREHNPIGYEKHQPYYDASYDREIAPVYSEVYTGPLENPYVVGNPIQPDNMRVFSGRFDIANAILREMKKGVQKPSILLYGRRRMGKTSAIYHMSNRIQDSSFMDVYISGHSAQVHTDVDFCYYLVRKIDERLQQASVDVDTSVFQEKGFLKKDTFLQNPVLTLSEFFEECQKI